MTIRINNLAKYASKVVIVISCTMLSLFIYANVYERLLLIDLPYIKSVEKVKVPYKLPFLTNENDQYKDEEKYGFFGKPQYIRFNKIDYTLYLIHPAPNNEEFLVTNTAAAFYTYNLSNAGVLGDSLVFSGSNSNLLNFLTLLSEGDVFNITTDTGWKYNYRITTRRVIDNSEQYVSNNTNPGKIYFLKNGSSNTVLVVEAEYLNVEDLNI